MGAYSSVYVAAVREARRTEDAQWKRQREQDDARIARVLSANSGKPWACPHPLDFRRCLDECRGCCKLSYVAPSAR